MARKLCSKAEGDDQTDQGFDLTAYMNRSISQMVQNAWRLSLANPREAVFLARCVLTQRRAAGIRSAYEKKGRHIPPFLIASITGRCNLFCKGCYARANQLCGEERPDSQLPVARWGEIFQEAKSLGVSFILLAGGEPLLRRPVLELAARCPSVVFPVFTNGTLLDASFTRLFSRHRNLVPILSLEGGRRQTDDRRGEGTYDRLVGVMGQLGSRGVFFGVSITVTTENLRTVTDDGFIAGLADFGCRVVLYVEYVPVAAAARLAPGDAERQYLEQRLEELRRTFTSQIFISFPGDEKCTGGCLAAGRGFFHINTVGGAEPCPFSPYSDTSLKTVGLLDALESPLFLRLNQAGALLGEHDGGCLLFAKENEVRQMVSESGSAPESGRSSL